MPYIDVSIHLVVIQSRKFRQLFPCPYLSEEAKDSLFLAEDHDTCYDGVHRRISSSGLISRIAQQLFFIFGFIPVHVGIINQ